MKTKRGSGAMEKGDSANRKYALYMAGLNRESEDYRSPASPPAGIRIAWAPCTPVAPIMERSIRLFATMLAALFSMTSAGQGLPQGSPIKPAPGWRPEPVVPTPTPPPHAAEVRNRSSLPLPGQDSFYDTTNPAFLQLQKANQSLAGLPLDRAGFVDWMRLLKEQKISPRAGLSGVEAMQLLDLDVMLKNTKQMPWVRFPHLSHTAWLDCSNCHPQPFEKKAGSAKISMESIFRGQWCGTCHDRVAFVTHFACERCHSVPNPSAGAGE